VETIRTEVGNTEQDNIRLPVIGDMTNVARNMPVLELKKPLELTAGNTDSTGHGPELRIRWELTEAGQSLGAWTFAAKLDPSRHYTGYPFNNICPPGIFPTPN